MKVHHFTDEVYKLKTTEYPVMKIRFDIVTT